MATLHLTPDTIEIRLTVGERIAALRFPPGGAFRLPRTAVRAVEVVPDGGAAVRGLRAPGLAVPGVRKIGTWRAPGRTEFVSVRADQPAVRLVVNDKRFSGLLIGADDAAAVARALQRDVGGEPATGTGGAADG